jgi:hypothetical protein
VAKPIKQFFFGPVICSSDIKSDGGPTEARPADGLTVDFVVESDRAQLSQIVQRVRDGRLRTNIGNIATLDEPDRATQGEDDHPRSSMSDTRPLAHADENYTHRLLEKFVQRSHQ